MQTQLASNVNRVEASIIVCTHNRCQSLAKTLQSIASSTASLEWEVIVVDNASTDSTREVVEKFCGTFPDRFRYLFEPQKGKSHALNTGVRHACGEILAFTDDDLIVEPTWLENLVAGLRGNGFAGSSGRVLLPKDLALPEWLTIQDPYANAIPLALRDMGSKALQFTDPLIGANMAVRKTMFEKYGGFRTDLGPPPKLRGEDTEFSLRLVKAGEVFWYEPSAVVYHVFEPSRLRKTYFLMWWFGLGRMVVRLRVERAPGNQIVDRLRSTISRCIRASTLHERFFRACQLSMIAGEMVESFYQYAQPKIRRLPTKNAWRR